jgi:hypothetical protein
MLLPRIYNIVCGILICAKVDKFGFNYAMLFYVILCYMRISLLSRTLVSDTCAQG